MVNSFQDVSNGMASVVESAAAHLVRIEGRRRFPASGIIYSADGVIVTSNHVVERDENLRVGLPDGSVVPATLIGRDPSTDLAVLRVEATNLTPAAWDLNDQARVGHLVLALGRPHKTVQATLGVVSALGDGWRTALGGTIDKYVQTDVTMYPGFSGGALVSAAGHFVGLNTSALGRGVSLTIPAATIARVVEMLLAHGHIKRGYLGVSAQPVRLPNNIAADLAQETGLMLVAVEENSPAASAGLTLGDTIVTLNGAKVRMMDDLMAQLNADVAGKTVLIKIVRGGQVSELSVTIGERS